MGDGSYQYVRYGGRQFAGTIWGSARAATIGLSRRKIWLRQIFSSNTFLYKSPNFKSMPRKKVKAHKKTSAYKVFRLIDKGHAKT